MYARTMTCGAVYNFMMAIIVVSLFQPLTSSTYILDIPWIFLYLARIAFSKRFYLYILILVKSLPINYSFL